MNIQYDRFARTAYNTLSDAERENINQVLATVKLDDTAQVRQIAAGKRKGSYVINPTGDLRVIFNLDSSSHAIVVTEIINPNVYSN